MNEVTTKNQELALINADQRDWPVEVQALPSDREKLFVLLFLDSQNGAKAARDAGYGNAEKTSTAETMARIAYRLLHTDRIVEAMTALVKRDIRTLGPAAHKAMKQILETPFHKDLGKIALAIAERIEPTVQRVEGNILHTHVTDHEGEAEAQYRTLLALGVARDRLIEVFGQFGLERLEAKAKPVIDAEYEEVPRDPDAELFGE